MAPTSVPTSLIEPFRQPEFDVAAFVRDVNGQGQERAARLLQQLEDCGSSLEEDLQRQIIACHEELLQNASNISDLDGHLGDVREVVEALKSSVQRIHRDVLVRFQGVKRRTVLLERMQAVNVLIRRLLRFLFDARKLRTQMEAPSKDFSKAAHTLQELEAVLQESSLERIDLLRAEVLWIRETGARIRKQADDDLRNGVKQGDQMAVGVALQVFFNLKCLWQQLEKLVAQLLLELTQAALPSGPGFQQSLDMHLQILVAHVHRLHSLDELLQSKTDALTHQRLSVVLEEQGISLLALHFWTEACKAFKVKFARVLQDKAARKGLVAECPRILNAIGDAMEKLSTPTAGTGQALRASDRSLLVAAVSELRDEFLGESIRRVTNPVEMMLSDKLVAALSATGGDRYGGVGAMGMAAEGNKTDELPTSHDVKRYVQLLVAELERCEVCPELLLKEAVKNARSSIFLFATRLEQVVDMSSLELRCFQDEASLQLASPLAVPTAGHARNARIFGIAHNALAAMRDLVPERFHAAVVTTQVQATLQQIQESIIAPIVGMLRRALYKSLTNLEGPADRTEDGSKTMLAVSQVCSHVSRYYFALFGTGQLAPYFKDLCSTAVRSFLSAAALTKCYTEASRRALLQDMGVLETMLATIDPDFPTRIHAEVAVFKEFRKLLFATSLQQLDLEGLLNVLPLHILMTYVVHQLPLEVPTLPRFADVTVDVYLETTLLPLWDEKPEAVAAFKNSIADLCDKHDVDPTSSPLAAFIMAHTE